MEQCGYCFEKAQYKCGCLNCIRNETVALACTDCAAVSFGLDMERLPQDGYLLIGRILAWTI